VHSLDRRFFPGFIGVSHFTCDIRWAAGAEKLTVNVCAVQCAEFQSSKTEVENVAVRFSASYG